ncbi:MAG: hypothetical protein JO121_11560 [Deltaproteobacteria bacterium]|nr:hypothetical protein [Deltaproteobacteria bacterium]
MPYIEALADHWGELCASNQVAAKWADDLLGTTRMAVSPDKKLRGFFHGTMRTAGWLRRTWRRAPTSSHGRSSIDVPAVLARVSRVRPGSRTFVCSREMASHPPGNVPNWLSRVPRTARGLLGIH